MAADSWHVSHNQNMVVVYDMVHYTATSAHGSFPPHHGKYDIPKSATRNYAMNAIIYIEQSKHHLMGLKSALKKSMSYVIRMSM